ncbi:glycoside hydrolase family protein [Flavicella sediminum]|uniref:hypothetical protein n=1 Tax=Flavicella sediminum TaxID=2585141 RepID=UPI001124955E|nr:hypothetical protein [Flavicella sediminum]
MKITEDGGFVLHVSDNSVYKSDKMQGPWERIGRMTMDARGFKDSNRFGSNLTSEYRPDGSIIVMKKDGDITLSEKQILGPYKMMSINNYTRSTGYPEDPVIWRSRHQYHAIYNHAQDRKSGYMRSIDGIHWKNEEGLPYDASTTYYTDGTQNTWYKFERPKVIQDELGRATHLSLAVMDVAKSKEKPNDNHSSKNMIMPLNLEKIITIIEAKQVNNNTKKIKIKMEAEVDFDPQNDLDIQSLRFGSDQLVNYGGGSKAIKTEKSGNDLIVTFKGDLGLNHRDFDLKLLGKNKRGALIYGYAVLPMRSIKEASCIILPISVEKNNRLTSLHSRIENAGLTRSKPCRVELREYSATGLKVLDVLNIASMDPYQSKSIDFKVEKRKDCAYEMVILGDYNYDEYWRKQDDTSNAVKYTGSWERKNAPLAFLNSEMVSTTLGDAVTFSFKGTRVKVFGQLGRQFGSFKVYMDGEYIETIRCNYAPVSQSPIYQSDVLINKKHVLKLVKTETEYNGQVTIDAFAVELPK